MENESCEVKIQNERNSKISLSNKENYSTNLNPHEAENGTLDIGLHEACGLFGCVLKDGPVTDKSTKNGHGSEITDVAQNIYLALIGLQHRGQESAGIVTSPGNGKFCVEKGMGEVKSAFTEDGLRKLKGQIGIAAWQTSRARCSKKNQSLQITQQQEPCLENNKTCHVRYSTQGESSFDNIQPFVVETLQGKIAVAHNGELVNAKSLKNKILRHGVGLSTGSDSELLTQLLTHQPDCGEPNGANWLGRIRRVMEQCPMSYSLLILLPDRIYALRDPYGNRPLCLGYILPERANLTEALKKEFPKEEVNGWVVSSESCAFNVMSATYFRDVLPGEVVEISKDGIKSRMILERKDNRPPAFCFFEYVYFARMDSFFEGQEVYSVRKRCGKRLAIEAPVDADLITTVPDSATHAAIAYSLQVGIPFMHVLHKNPYVGRTFIQPTQNARQKMIALKYGPAKDDIVGKRIILIDDSIVRGNTMRSIVRLLKHSGAKEVHVRIASPPLKYACYMGINIPTREELVANQMPLEEIGAHIEADSLQYLSIEGMLSAIHEGLDKTRPFGHCMACVTGVYPVELDW